MRKPVVAGNWKMNKTTGEAKSLAEGIKLELENVTKVDVILCPTFTALQTVADVISDTNIKLGAQNMHWNNDGAHTGEIAPGMLRDLYCKYVIVGHSERRADCGETDEIVNTKAKAAIANGLTPIICVGETLEQREAGETNAVNETQVRGCLAGIEASDVANSIIAYEPVWAIGTGKTATPEMAQDVHAHIRAVVADLYDEATAQSVRIQYGGSMKPDNAEELLAQPDIDGGLIGGAALDAVSFVAIINAAM